MIKNFSIKKFPGYSKGGIMARAYGTIKGRSFSVRVQDAAWGPEIFLKLPGKEPGAKKTKLKNEFGRQWINEIQIPKKR